MNDKDKLRLFRLLCGLAAITLPLLGHEQLVASLFLLAAALRGNEAWDITAMDVMLILPLLLFAEAKFWRYCCAFMGVFTAVIIYFST